MKKIEIKNIYLILVISIGLIGLGIGSTYAMFTASDKIDNPISLSSNLSSEEDIFESFDITLNSKENKSVKFNITNSNNLNNLKYASWYIYEGNDSDLTFYTSISSTSDIEPNGILSTTGGVINIKIVNNTTNKINLVIGVSTSKDNIILPNYMKLISSNEEPKELLADYITNLYTTSSKSTVTNNSITYNYAPSVSLMNDRLGSSSTDIDGGNIRYYGASPNNYIYFNCSDYSNQSDTTCEKWRIIGVFGNQVKIMRNEQIGEYSWDTSASDVNSGYGVNEWSQADLMKLLNPGYSSESVGGSLYYNSEKGTCYNNYNNSSTSCDFTSSGIKNDETKNKIAEVTWNLGGCNSYHIYSNQIYSYERGTKVVSNPSDGITRTTTWKGKVALPYPSDYGYATDFNKCTQKLSSYSNSSDSYACRSNDWMYPIITNSSSNHGWLLTPCSGNESVAWNVGSSGYVDISLSASHAYGVVPTLYLNANEYVESGNGTESNPYHLMKDSPVETASKYITNIYTNADKTPVKNNEIDYNYAPDESLMNDRLGGTTSSLDGGNIRYYGASPNNYIYFNCETYPDTNCELWRIIGVFDGKVKIMRNESIGYLPWNTVAPYNNWSNATLMKVLNPGYETENRNNSLYYNKLSGTCSYSYSTDDDCDFTSKGIKNTITKDKIAEVTWSIGGMSTANVYSNQAYALERGTTVYSGNDTTWFGKITIPYVSDFGYAADFNGCTTTLHNYNGNNVIINPKIECRTTNWMSTIMGAKSGGIISWFLTHYSSDSGSIFELPNYENYPGIAWNNTGGGTARIFPTLYLKSEETIVEGTTGTIDNPYKLNP